MAHGAKHFDGGNSIFDVKLYHFRVGTNYFISF
jgi:hypothetical protein